MPRRPRIDVGDLVYHVINRANGRVRLFAGDAAYESFLSILDEARRRTAMRLLSYCVMPNHWHLVVWPRNDGDLAVFVRWLSLTHAQRHHTVHDCVGAGHLYQGRYKSFVVKTDHHFLKVCRYVERNALRARLVRRAEQWRWSSLWYRRASDPEPASLVTPWPVPEPAHWLDLVNEPYAEDELRAIRDSVNRGSPYGDADWTTTVARRFDIQSALRPRGRPRRGT